MFFLIITGFLINCVFTSTRVFLDTIYEVDYINYNNLDFNNIASVDSCSKIYSFLNSALKISIDNFEFKVNFCSIGEVGDNNFQVSTYTYLWQKNLPYPNVSFLPWISESYIRYTYNFEFLKENVEFISTIGRQKKEFINGMVLGDNGIGYDGFSFCVNLGKYLYLDSLFSRVISYGGFIENKKFDLYSFLVGSKYYKSFDFGISTTLENNEILNFEKIFYEFFIKRELTNYYYIFEYSFQTGRKEQMEYSGNLWFLKAATRGKNKYLGESEASLVWLLSSGGDERNKFEPSFYRKYYFLEPYGYGDFAKANINNIFFDLPQGYSGIFVLGFNLLINPLKRFFAGLGYYLFSSPSAPDNKPEPSATEKTLGAKKAIGVEYDFSVRYSISDILDISLCYSIFNPTKGVYEKDEDATKLGIYVKSKF